MDPGVKAALISRTTNWSRLSRNNRLHIRVVFSHIMNRTPFVFPLVAAGIIGLAAFAYLNGKTQNALDDIAEVRKNVSNLLYQAKAAMQG